MIKNESNSTVNTVIQPFFVEDVPWEDWNIGERFGGRARRLGDFGGGSHIGVVIEELLPGKQSSPAHYHLLEEEHLFVLSGQMSLCLDQKTYDLSVGDYVCFPAGQAVAHTLINRSDAPCQFLMIGERNHNDVIVYPSSGKIKVRLTDEIYDKTPLDYWDGEENALPSE